MPTTAHVTTATAPDPSSLDAIAATLDGWTSRDWSDGLDLSALDGLAAVEVITRHSIYYLVPAATPGELAVRGGRHLPAFRPARVLGCSKGGALLKQHALHIGFRMEIVFDEMRLVTSEVTHLRVLPVAHD